MENKRRKTVNEYEILEIKDIIAETKTIKTFVFDWEMYEGNIPKPGQFMMVWNFKGNINEKPMSISKIDEKRNEIAITIKNIGEFTNTLHKKAIGDKIGLRGPYGNGFNLLGDKILAIGGGVGMAPISAFVNYGRSIGKSIDVISASTTKDELLFANEDTFTCTDDGTCGFKGFATHRTIDILKSRAYDSAVVCGPEIMMKGIYDILESASIPGQYSMERYMKCAIGICGQCCLDDTGWRVCIEGPVFNSTDMKEIIEFGKYHRDSNSIKQYY